MRAITVAILLAARAASADHVAVGVSTFSDDMGGLPEKGVGPAVELSAGDQIKALVEGSYEWVGLDDDSLHGRRARGGIGLRWTATSLVAEGIARVDLVLDAYAGYARTAWIGGGSIARPDLGFGWGVRDRFTYAGHDVGLQVELRVVFSPTERDDMMVACRGRCTAMASARAAGLAGVMELTW